MCRKWPFRGRRIPSEMLTFRVAPGQRLGPFVLGSSIQDVISLLKTNDDFACVQVGRFTPEFLEKREEGVLRRDVEFDLLDHGIRLIFDVSLQTLRLIEVYDFTRCRIDCSGEAFGGALHLPTYSSLYAVYGATFSSFVRARGKDAKFPCLFYPGLLIVFPSTEGMRQSARSKSLREPGRADDPELLASTAVRLYICGQGSETPSESLASQVSKSYSRRIMALPGHGIYFRKETQRRSSSVVMLPSDVQICIRDAVQEVVAQLGEADEIFLLRNSSEYEQAGAITKGYVLNYFDLGMDIVFSERHSVSKIILHANDLQHRDFGVYKKCNFDVVLPLTDCEDGATASFPTLFHQILRSFKEMWISNLSQDGRDHFTELDSENRKFETTEKYVHALDVANGEQEAMNDTQGSDLVGAEAEKASFGSKHSCFSEERAGEQEENVCCKNSKNNSNEDDHHTMMANQVDVPPDSDLGHHEGRSVDASLASAWEARSSDSFGGESVRETIEHSPSRHGVCGDSESINAKDFPAYRELRVDDPVAVIHDVFGYLPEPALHPAEAAIACGTPRIRATRNATAYLLGYPGIVFEIVKDSHMTLEEASIASVTVFDAESDIFS